MANRHVYCPLYFGGGGIADAIFQKDLNQEQAANLIGSAGILSEMIQRHDRAGLIPGK